MPLFNSVVQANPDIPFGDSELAWDNKDDVVSYQGLYRCASEMTRMHASAMGLGDYYRHEWEVTEKAIQKAAQEAGVTFVNEPS